MIDLTGIDTFESRGNITHSHYDGREIRRKFYLEPFRKAPQVAEAMLGFVSREFEGGPWTRHFPVQDPCYPWCYCNEVIADPIHPDTISISPTLDLDGLDNEWTPQLRYTRLMTQLNTVPDDPCAGCFLTASYRPLISAYEPFSLRHEFEGQVFDWIDPQFKTAVRTAPWPDGLLVAVKDKSNIAAWHPAVPEEVGQPINIPVNEFIVKRLFVGEAPYELLDELLNGVNEGTWPGPNYRVPRFAKGTLKFINYEVIEHFSPASSKGVWYELVYHFLWLDLMAKPVFDTNGDPTGIEGWDHVTWNHVFMRPNKMWGLFQDEMGWYFVAKAEERFWYLTGRQAQVGPLHTFVDFGPMFMLNPPVVEPIL